MALISLVSRLGLDKRKPMAITKGAVVCWSSDPRWRELPIINLPPDAIRVRVRARVDSVARAYVRRPGGVEDWVLQPIGTDPQKPISTCYALKLGFLQGVNQTKEEI